MRTQSIFLYSILLVVVGLGGYFLSGQASYTALIPAALGVLIYAADFLARRSIGKLWPGVTGILALVGAGGSFRGIGALLGSLSGSQGTSLASISQTITFILCVLVIVAVVVRWKAARV